MILYDRHVSQVTHILEAIQQGNPKAAEELLPLVARCGVTSAAGKFMLAAVMLAATFVFALLPVSGVPGHSQGQQDNDSESKVQQGFAIAPVPLDLRGKNRALVGKGSYIVNVPLPV